MLPFVEVKTSFQTLTTASQVQLKAFLQELLNWCKSSLKAAFVFPGTLNGEQENIFPQASPTFRNNTVFLNTHDLKWPIFSNNKSYH